MHALSWKVSSLAAVLAVSLGSGLGCGGGGESALEKSLPPPTKKLSELKAAKPEMSKEELEAARRAAGFKSRDEIAKENAEMFEGDAKAYIKARTKDYKALLADFRKELEGLEKAAGKWSGAKDPQKDFDKFAEKYKETTTELTKRYMELTGNGAEGGNTQAVLSKAFRTWEDLNNDLNPQIGAQERFAEVLADIRKGFDEVEKAVDEIEKDESITAAGGGGEEETKK